MLRSLLLASFSLALAAQTPATQAPATVAPSTQAPATQAPATKATPSKATPPKAAPAKVDRILARVGKEVIRESDFDYFIELSLPENQRAQVQMMPGAKEQYLKRFLDFKVLAAKAEKDGVDKNNPEYAKRMKFMKMQALIQTLFDRDGGSLRAKSTLKDEDVKAYFDKHPDKFRTPEAFTARHILVSTKAQGEEKARTDEEALARVKEIQAALKAGKPWDDLAKQYSDDPGSKDKGGLYADTPFGRFVPEFEKAVRAQAVGKVGEPVKSMFGYHLIIVEKITPAAPQTFEAAKEAARKDAAAELQEKVMDEYMKVAKAETGFVEGAAPAPGAPKVRKGMK